MDTQVRTYSKFPLVFDGELGREIYEYIINTPKSDLTELYKEVDLEEKRRLGDVKNET